MTTSQEIGKGCSQAPAGVCKVLSVNDHREKTTEAALHPHPPSRNQGLLLQALQEAAGKSASLGDTPAGKGGAPGP